ncbi:PQQ-binding-like beta-propeller repeat protein [Naumannella halotolerans]|uniref:outer membrane protein assembly factor BamB family protein n=1 Tax=Naumannella halotolerans TaxID=993414 RepID=UPI00370DA09C
MAATVAAATPAAGPVDSAGPVAGLLPARAVTEWRSDSALRGTWQVNQAVLPGEVGWSGLPMPVREQVSGPEAEQWLGVDAIGPVDNLQRTSLDFAVSEQEVRFVSAATNGGAVSFSPGLPVLDPVILSGERQRWSGRVRTNDEQPVVANALITAEPIGNSCTRTVAEIGDDSYSFDWCPGEGLSGWVSTIDSVGVGFEMETVEPPTVADPAGFDDVAATELRGTEVRPIRFFRTVAGQYREELVPMGSRAAWAGDQLVVADTGGRVTSWLPLDDADGTAAEDFSGHLAFWRTTPGGSVRGLATVGAVTVVGTTDRAVIAYDRDGRELWRRVMDEAVTSVLSWGELIVAADAGGTVVALAAGDGTQSWLADGIEEVLAVGGSNAGVVMVRRGTTVQALSTTTGDPLWSTRFDGDSTAVAVSGDTVGLRVGNWLVAHEARTGRRLWHDSIADGRFLYGIPAGLVVTGRRTTVLDAGGNTVWENSDRMIGADPLVPSANGSSSTADELVADGPGRLLVGGPGEFELAWDYPAQREPPELAPVRADRGVITLQREPTGYGWLEYR